MSTLRYIPLDASESAFLKDTESFLPVEVYQQLADFIAEAVEKVSEPDTSSSLKDLRSHNAVSVDGSRGTGKTAVLVNLRKYIDKIGTDKKILNSIHILEPVDPTLLEDNESLFLHIIVAALLSDKTVQAAQRIYPEKSQRLNKSLELLASALESVETQNSDYGMAKLRALFGNHRLAGYVQDFFKATLDLLGKKLLVLPIDDVDTSLNRAFENLEIIRRYLTTPYVLTIVSGDRDLYNEVTWRDFHGRLIKDSNYKKQQAYDHAVDLANEYQRKLLPLPRRLEMPDIQTYLHNREIILGDKNDTDRKNSIPLNNFYSWLQIFIAGPVNGQEGSQLELPVPSIRALTQLVNKCGTLIPKLPVAFRHAKSALQVQRAWQMPEVSNDAIEAFKTAYQNQVSAGRDYRVAYKVFAEALETHPAHGDARLDNALLLEWEKTLLRYFQYEPKAGAVALVLQASTYWQSRYKTNQDERSRSIFDTPLFQPMQHEEREFKPFDKTENLVEWRERLQKRLPGSWLNLLDSYQTILPYPLPDVGVNSRRGWKYWGDISTELKESEAGGKVIFLASLATHQNYYTGAKQSLIVNIGRIFEVIISSLVGEVHLEDLQRIVNSSPFFSASALAPTKKLDSEVHDASSERPKNSNLDIVDNRQFEIVDLIERQLVQLHSDIRKWRVGHGLNQNLDGDIQNNNNLEQVRFSPWMIYKVFNKVYSQFANAEPLADEYKDLKWVIETVGLAFYSTWSAFGSFEKGKLFGLPDVVATVNLNSPYNFDRSNELFNINLGPFAMKKSQKSPGKDSDNEPDTVPESAPDKMPHKALYGKCTRTASYYLADHPLRLWIEEVLTALTPKSIEASHSELESVDEQEIPSDSRIWLRKRLKLTANSRLTANAISKALDGFTPDVWPYILREMRAYYPTRKLTSTLENIIIMKMAER